MATVSASCSMARHRPHVPRLSPRWLRHERRHLLPGRLAGRTTTRSSIRPATARAPRRRARGTPGRIRFPTPSRAVFRCSAFQLGDNTGGSTIPAGSVYLDAITATGGTQNCAVATGTGTHTFEAALDANVYQKDGTDADTVATQSTERANMGTGSWKVAFTALPAPASGATTSRRVYINGPNIYCGQVATVHVYLPAGSDGLTFQVFAQYNNYAKFGAAGPASVTRDALEHLRLYHSERRRAGRHPAPRRPVDLGRNHGLHGQRLHRRRHLVVNPASP